MSEIFRQDPKAWFDQFNSVPVPEPMKSGSHQFCWRHWAPAPMLGANGIGFTITMMQRFMEDSPECTSAEEFNEKLNNIGYVCCHYGDTVCYELWSEWGPDEHVLPRTNLPDISGGGVPYPKGNDA